MRKHMKHTVAFCFIPLLLCGCTSVGYVPPSISPSEIVAPESNEYNFRDMTGNLITLDTGLNAVEVSYTLGWNPNQEGYIRLEDGLILGNTEISHPLSHYYLSRQQDGSIKPLCTGSQYTLHCDTTISGILQVDKHAMVFFPYEDEDIPLFALHPRSKDAEEECVNATHIVTTDGTELQIKPIGIQFGQQDQDALLSLLKLNEFTTARWYDIVLPLSSIYLSGFTDGTDTELFATRAFADLQHGESLSTSTLIINGELSFSDLIGRTLLFWIYRYD